ncbi:hypothetical protein L596_030514 [Steinernema carpocapsae]|uniref:7TM GPCR serpentine receptor class x (Srx) domain-containing protein n=1 Tax=Steinernema carpocapsae TaxID=34508 RepID=A0A4U5LPM8_STECR|nr:hypothetical protein L596_030514 [Steinernema carpocapsae]
MLIGCLMQLTTHFIGGVMTVTENTFNHQVERVFGAWIQSGWFLYQGASLTLAVDRVMIFLSKSGGAHACFVCWSFIAFSFLLAVVYLVVLLIPDFGFSYSHYLDWFYDNTPGSRSMLTVEEILDFIILSGILILYFIVFLCLLKMRKTGTAGISSLSVELRILLIAVVSFVYECTYLAFFFWGSHLVTNETVNSVATSLLWIVDCGFFSLATMAINSSMRKKMFKIGRKSFPNSYLRNQSNMVRKSKPLLIYKL